MYKLPDPDQPIKVFIPVLYAFVGLLLFVMICVHYLAKVPYDFFTRDPAQIFGYNQFCGYISNIGFLLWCATASVCFLTAAILNVRRDQREVVKFLVCFGALTAVLMFDDMYMFHESIAPSLLHIPEKVVYLFYGVYSLFCFVRFQRIILTYNVLYLVLAIGAFGSSVVFDQLSDKYNIPAEYLLEDGAKFIGIASWLAYFVDLSFNKTMSLMGAFQLDTVRGKLYRNVREKEMIYN